MPVPFSTHLSHLQLLEFFDKLFNGAFIYGFGSFEIDGKVVGACITLGALETDTGGRVTYNTKLLPFILCCLVIKVTISSIVLQSFVKPPSVARSPKGKRSLSSKTSSVARRNSSTFRASKRYLSAIGSWLYFFSKPLNNSVGLKLLPSCYST